MMVVMRVPFKPLSSRTLAVSALLLIAGCSTLFSGPLTDTQLAWCSSDSGAADVARAAGSGAGLPMSPWDRIRSQDSDSTSEWLYVMSDLRTVPWTSPEAKLVLSYHRAHWSDSFLRWKAANPEEFERACRNAVPSSDRMPNEGTIKALEVDADRLAVWTAFLGVMRRVASGTYFESWEDGELVGAGERLCFFYLTSQSVGAEGDKLVDSFDTIRVETVYSHLFEVHPREEDVTVDLTSFNRYMETWAGPDWRGDFAEFEAALTYNAAHVLCPSQGEFVDSLVIESNAQARARDSDN